MKISSEIPIEPKQSFIVDKFTESDGIGVANLFLSVYGNSYPFDMYYYPERIAEANLSGDLLSVVAKTEKGDVIGHGALFRSFAINPQAYELGQLIILNQYRGSFAAFRIAQYIKQNIIDKNPPECLFGEAVTNHPVSQKLSHFIGLSESALEIDFMPESMYTKEKGSLGRVSCLFQFLINNSSCYDVFLHPRCRDIMDLVFPEMRINRNIFYNKPAYTASATTSIKGRRFPEASISRYNIINTGIDAASVIDGLITEAEQDHIKVLQFIVNVSEPHGIEAFDILFDRGFFCGGWLPLWFDKGDGFLLQWLRNKPNFTDINLFSDKSERLLGLIKNDYELALNKAPHNNTIKHKV